MPPNVPLDQVRHVDLDKIFVAYCKGGDVHGKTCNIQQVRNFVNVIRRKATIFGGGRGSIYRALNSMKDEWGTNPNGRSDSDFKTDPRLEDFLKNSTTFRFRGGGGGGGSNGRGGGGGFFSG